MAKQLTFTDPLNGETYTLEFTRKTVEQMERSGFVSSELASKPMLHLPRLFAGAFLAHHRFVRTDVIDDLYSRMKNKDDLLSKLIEMYNEPLETLMAEPEEEDESKNMEWSANW